MSFLFSRCIWRQHTDEFLPSFLEFSRDTLRHFGSWGKSQDLFLSESKWRHKPTIQKTTNLHHFTRKQPYNLICVKIANGRLIFRIASSCATWRKVFRWLARHGIPTSERRVNSLVGQFVLQECRMKRDPVSIDKKSTRRYGKSRNDTKPCPQLVLVLMDPCGKQLLILLYLQLAQSRVTQIDLHSFRRGLRGRC